jgi:hypothetical protein
MDVGVRHAEGGHRGDVRCDRLRRHGQRGMHTGPPRAVRADLQHARSIARPPAGQLSETRRAPPSDSIRVPVRFWFVAARTTLSATSSAVATRRTGSTFSALAK